MSRIGVKAITTEPFAGIGVYTFHLLKALQQQNQNIIPWHFSSPKAFLKTYFSRSKNDPPMFLSAAFPPFCSLHKELEKNIDIFHSMDYHIPRLKRTPVVATLHDAFMLKNPEWCHPRLERLRNFLFKQTLPWAQHYIAISHAMVADLVNYLGIKEEKISVIYPGVASEWFVQAAPLEKQRVLMKYNLTPGFILFVSSIQPRKNLERIVTAFKRLPARLRKQHKLVIVGSDQWRAENIACEINKLQANDEAIWLRSIPVAEIRVLYQCASVLMYPSLGEGFGFPVIEGFASRTPVLTSTLTSLPEIAGDAAYLVDPYNVDEIYEGTLKLLTDQQLRQQCIQKGFLRAQEFSWEKCAIKTIEIYQKFL